MSGHPFLQRHHRRHVAAWLAVGALVAWSVLLLTSRPAYGHFAELTVSTSCAEDGTWLAHWSLTNSEAGKVMEIEAEDVTDLEPNPVPRSGTATDTTSHAEDLVVATVVVDWVEHPSRTYSAEAHRPADCVPTTTTTTPTPPTTVPDGPPPTAPPAAPVPDEPEFTG
jgi:hypothetical protein